jgi:hypothetical protein
VDQGVPRSIAETRRLALFIIWLEGTSSPREAVLPLTKKPIKPPTNSRAWEKTWPLGYIQVSVTYSRVQLQNNPMHA